MSVLLNYLPLLACILCQKDSTIQTDCNSLIALKRDISQIMESGARHLLPLTAGILHEHLTAVSTGPEFLVGLILRHHIGSDLIRQLSRFPRLSTIVGDG